MAIQCTAKTGIIVILQDEWIKILYGGEDIRERKSQKTFRAFLSVLKYLAGEQH